MEVQLPQIDVPREICERVLDQYIGPAIKNHLIATEAAMKRLARF